jgi:hypothetical protein
MKKQVSKKSINLKFTSFELIPKSLGGFRRVTHEFDRFCYLFENSMQFKLYLASDEAGGYGINLSAALRDFITSKTEGLNSNWEYPTFSLIYKAMQERSKVEPKYVKI